MRSRIPALALVVILALVPLAGCGDDDESSGGDSGAESGSVYGGSSSGDDSAAAEEGAAAEDDSATGEGGAGADAGAAPDAASVEIVDFAYDPVNVTVSVGGTVEWTNSDSAPHTATAEDDRFDTGSLDKGDAAKITFDEAGSFKYICTFHPFMNATVEVVE